MQSTTLWSSLRHRRCHVLFTMPCWMLQGNQYGQFESLFGLWMHFGAKSNGRSGFRCNQHDVQYQLLQFVVFCGAQFLPDVVHLLGHNASVSGHTEVTIRLHPISFALVFRSTSTRISFTVSFRCVHDDQRSFALGIQWIKVRIFGTIPAPLIFGTLIDDTCLLWQESCDNAGACLVYDNYSMSK